MVCFPLEGNVNLWAKKFSCSCIFKSSVLMSWGVLFVSKNFHAIFARTEAKFIGFKPFVQGCKGIIQAVLEVARHRY